MFKMNKKINIIGAGLSGCVLARLFADSGWIVNLYEKNNHIGGNCYDYKNEHNILIHKYGPHIFHTDNDEVWNFLNRFTKFNNYVNKVLVCIDEKLIQMPINLNSVNLLFPEKYKEFISKINIFFPNKSFVTIKELLSINDKTISEISNFIYKNIYKNYTEKMWGKSIEEVDNSVLERVKINLNKEWNYFANDKYQGLPIDGYTTMLENIINHKNIFLFLNCDPTKNMDFNNNKITINGKNELIIYSGMIDCLFKYKFDVLPYRSLNIKFETYNKKSYQESAVVNFPSHPTMTRITEYKKMTFQDSDYTTISKEFPGEYNKNSLEFNVPFYPINNDETKKIFDKYFTESKKYKNLFLIGRLGLYKYFDMDDCIEECFVLFKNIINKQK